MKFLLISPKNRTIHNFRGDLIREIIFRGYDVVVTGPNDNDIDKVLALGVRFARVPLDKNGLSVVGDIQYLIALYRLCRAEKPDITLGYTIKPVIYGAIAARLAGVKSVNSMVTGAGYLFVANSMKARLIGIIVRLLFRIGFLCCHKAIFQNRDDLNEFTAKRLVRRDKCHLVNGSGVNMERFKPEPFPERLTFFMLSRIIYSKGVREYLQAAEVVKSRFPHVRFMLLGAVESIQDSMPMEELSKYIDKGVIDYFGETADVVSFYRKCSVFVLPSYREGIPRTVLEAMAMGRPLITTDTPGCRETVVDGINGFIVLVRDINSLVDKMVWFLQNPDRIKKMGSASVTLCMERFEVGQVNKSMMKHLGIL